MICLGKIPDIKTVLDSNPDPRFDWVKTATIEEAKSKEWQKRYWKWKVVRPRVVKRRKGTRTEENMAATFPRFDSRVHQAISNMRLNIENRN